MKTLKAIILGLLVGLFVSPVFAQSYINKASGNAKISQLIGKANIMTSIKCWDLGKLDGVNKYMVKFQAIEVTDNQISEITKGIKVIVYDDNKKTEAQLASLFYFDRLETYIDLEEYEDIITSLNYMINSLNMWSNEKIDQGSLYYKTNDNLIFGFEQDGKKQTGYMKIKFERVEFVCELKKLDNSLKEMKGFIETASKDLYLDANLEKFKQAQEEEEERKKEAEKAMKEKEKEKKKKVDDTQTTDDEDQL